MPSLSYLALSLLAGALTTLSPCVLPLLPLIVGGVVQRHPWAPVWMGLGMAGTFALIGAVLSGLGAAIGPDPEQLRLVGAVLLCGFALAMLLPALSQALSGLLQPLASLAESWSRGLDSGRPFGALALGALLGMVWSPCSGPLLGGILALAATEGGGLPGFLLLSLFGLGAALPLVGVAYLSRAGMGWLRSRLQVRLGMWKPVFAVLLLLAGLGILSGADRLLEAALVERIPEFWLNWIGRY